MEKYFKTKKEAFKARDERMRINPTLDLHVWKMPKGTRKHGWFAVCNEMEYLNTY